MAFVKRVRVLISDGGRSIQLLTNNRNENLGRFVFIGSSWSMISVREKSYYQPLCRSCFKYTWRKTWNFPNDFQAPWCSPPLTNQLRLSVHVSTESGSTLSTILDILEKSLTANLQISSLIQPVFSLETEPNLYPTPSSSAHYITLHYHYSQSPLPQM